LPAVTSPVDPLDHTSDRLDFYSGTPQYSANFANRTGESIDEFFSLLPGDHTAVFIIGKSDLRLYVINDQNVAFGPVRRECSFFQEVGITKNALYNVLKDREGGLIFRDYWYQHARSNPQKTGVIIVKNLCKIMPVSVYAGARGGDPDYGPDLEDACGVFAPSSLIPPQTPTPAKEDRAITQSGPPADMGPGQGWDTGGGYPVAGTNGYGDITCIYCPLPPYSDQAVKSKFQGAVELQVTVTPDGGATDIRLVKGVGMGLDEQAVQTVRGWRFKPSVGPNGSTVTATAIIEVTFRLR
jgi:TonB family protein